jgi:hypothetical protein
MLHFLSPVSLSSLGSPLTSSTDPVSPHTILTWDAYISPFGQVITHLNLATSIKDRTDIISVVYFDDKLLILTTTGEVYGADGTLYLKGVRSISNEDVMVVNYYNNTWSSHAEITDLTHPDSMDGNLPSETEYAISSGNIGYVYLVRGEPYIRWIEDKGVMTRHRDWITKVKSPDMKPYNHLYQHLIPVKEVIRSVFTINDEPSVYLMGDQTLYRIDFKYVKRINEDEGAGDDEDALEEVKVIEVYTFHSRIQDVKVISDTTYVALLETGEVCHSSAGMFYRIGNKIIAIEVRAKVLYMYLDDESIRTRPLRDT